MRVITNAVVPDERKTVVELTDTDIRFILRGLYKDDTNDDENAATHSGFFALSESLGLALL